MRRIFILFIALLFITMNKGFARNVKDTIQLGVFIESIYDFNLTEYSVDANFWMWSVTKGTSNENAAEDSILSLKKLEFIGLTNAKKYEFTNKSTSRVDSNGIIYWWAYQYCRATIYQNWNLDKFPFDDQKMLLVFENNNDDTSIVIMQHDPKDKAIVAYKSDINLNGWEISPDSSYIRDEVKVYSTDFGNPVGNNISQYSRIVYSIGLNRVPGAKKHLFIELTFGMFVAFFVSWIIFFIRPEYVEPRFGLSIGALFAAVGNKYIADTNMPKNAPNSFIDRIHELTFIFILLTIVISAISLYLDDSKQLRARRIIDRTTAVLAIPAYIAAIYFVYYHPIF